MPTLGLNKKVGYDYEILDRMCAGLVLDGQEVKSVRSGHVSMKGAFAVFKGMELWIVNLHITPYAHAGKLTGYEPTRSRKLLLKKQEITRLKGKMSAEGLTLVPLKLYTHKSRIKLELGLARGKKKYEKRETIKKREVDREIQQRLKN